MQASHIVLFASLYGNNSLYFCRPQKCPKIRAYASIHGAAAAARHFSNKMGTTVSESTVKSIKSRCKDGLRKQHVGTGSSVVESLPKKKCGQTLLLGDDGQETAIVSKKNLSGWRASDCRNSYCNCKGFADGRTQEQTC